MSGYQDGYSLRRNDRNGGRVGMNSGLGASSSLEMGSMGGHVPFVPASHVVGSNAGGYVGGGGEPGFYTGPVGVGGGGYGSPPQFGDRGVRPGESPMFAAGGGGYSGGFPGGFTGGSGTPQSSGFPYGDPMSMQAVTQYSRDQPANPFPPFEPASYGVLGQQIFNNIVSDQGARIFDQGSEQVSRFMKMPKYYFQVNNRFVIRKILLLLFPLANKTWTRRRGIDSGEAGNAGDSSGYLPPTLDINAPDLYIPVMSFVTYILLIGYLKGRVGKFTAETMASTGSKGLALLLLEVLLVRLGLYLVQSRGIAWLDIVALQSYKFVPLTLILILGSISHYLYYLSIAYFAGMSGLFLMRTFRRVVLRDTVGGGPAVGDAKRNYFLLSVFLMQFLTFWLLAERT